MATSPLPRISCIFIICAYGLYILPGSAWEAVSTKFLPNPSISQTKTDRHILSRQTRVQTCTLSSSLTKSNLSARDNQSTLSPLATILDFVSGILPAKKLQEEDARRGVVVRTGVRGIPMHADEQRNRSPNKPSVSAGFDVTVEGAAGDYNMYRSKVLGNTPDRTLSIMTSDVISSLQSEGWAMQEGDLGENVLVSGVPYGFFSVGRRFNIGSVLVQITEPIQPCRSLCRLPFLPQGECMRFIKTLNGRRGWYAKVLNQGHVAPGDQVLYVA